MMTLEDIFDCEPIVYIVTHELRQIFRGREGGVYACIYIEKPDGYIDT